MGPDAQAKAAALKPGQIMLLENTRFEKGETKNDPELAKAMASMADVYVSDAFGAVHRAHASTAGVADYLPAVSGFLIQKELEIIGGALAESQAAPWWPFWAAARSPARSASSTTSWRSPTPSSSAAAWPTHLLRRPGRQGGHSPAGSRLGGLRQ